MKEKFSQSDPLQIRQFSKKLQSDPVLIRQKIGFNPDPVRSNPVPCSSLMGTNLWNHHH